MLNWLGLTEHSLIVICLICVLSCDIVGLVSIVQSLEVKLDLCVPHYSDYFYDYTSEYVTCMNMLQK